MMSWQTRSFGSGGGFREELSCCAWAAPMRNAAKTAVTIAVFKPRIMLVLQSAGGRSGVGQDGVTGIGRMALRVLDHIAIGLLPRLPLRARAAEPLLRQPASGHDRVLADALVRVGGDPGGRRRRARLQGNRGRCRKQAPDH